MAQTASNSCTQTSDCYDVKLAPAVVNANGTVTLSFSVTAKCNKDLSYIAFELPSNVSSASSYSTTSPQVNNLENPTNNPFYSIKFELGSGFVSPKTYTFSYTISAAGYALLTSIRVQAKAGQNLYNFTFNKNCGNPLPVELVSFKGVRTNSGVVLNWSTASEKSNDHFDIEKSVDGAAFSVIGRVAGHGSSTTANNYSFVDQQFSNQTNYYRLKQVDFDGTSVYSPVVTVAAGKAAQYAINAVPNPAEGSEFSIVRNSAISDANVEILDIHSKLIFTGVMKAGQLAAPVSTQNLAPGMYFVRISGEDGVTMTKVLVGNR